MKTKHMALLIAAVWMSLLTSFMLYQVRGMLPTIASTYIIVVCILLALAALCILAFLLKNLHRHVNGIMLAHYAAAEKRYALAEKRERWELEREERRAAIYLQMSRVSPGTYLIQPDMHLRPSERDVILLPAPVRQAQLSQAGMMGDQMPEYQELPTEVLYNDIRGQIPRGHILVGIGRTGIETKERAVGACTWIVGLSGTGKTSTTVLRVEERAADNHAFLGVDPHWFKDDSLFHAIYETLDGESGPYANRFLAPMAKTPAESLKILKTFLAEFNARKGGQRSKPWRRITLLVDEVGAMMDKATATTPEEKEIIDLLPSIARICGQEARNFEMGGIFISQQATGLAWLRKVALMVIVHQLLQESEKKLATNNDAEVMGEMKTWPIGRTYVYGVGFGTEGPRTVQQPYFKPTGNADELLPGEYIISEDDEYTEDDTTESDTRRTTGDLVPVELRAALEAWNNGAQGPRALQRALGCTYYQAGELCKELKRRRLVAA